MPHHYSANNRLEGHNIIQHTLDCRNQPQKKKARQDDLGSPFGIPSRTAQFHQLNSNKYNRFLSLLKKM